MRFLKGSIARSIVAPVIVALCTATLAHAATSSAATAHPSALVAAAAFPTAAVTLTNATALSDSAMARQTATGLQAPAIGAGGAARPSVVLWDELTIPSPPAPTSNTTVTVTVGLPGR